MVVPLLVLAFLASANPEERTVPHAKTGDEMGFGIDVARRGLWNEARFRFEKAVALAPENAHALNNLAVALEQQGAFDKAREAYEKALKIEPGNVYIQQNYDLFREADDKRNRKAKKAKP
jgi:Flp pilus assembly protein TadD